MKLIRIRSTWGPDNQWIGDFSDDSEEWDKHKNLREKLDQQYQSKKTEGKWWMDFSAWHENYSRLYMVKVFPESWEQYSIDSEWEGQSFGGCKKIFLFDIHHFHRVSSQRHGSRKIRNRRTFEK